MRVDLYAELTRCLEAKEALILATTLDGPGAGGQILVWPSGEVRGTLGGPRLDQRAALFAHRAFAGRQPVRKSFDTDAGPVEVFFDLLLPPPKLVLVGAVHVAVPLVTLARTLGMRTVVVDPRTAFATAQRFAHADRLLTQWPDEALRQEGLDESSYVAVLSHDLKLDLPALEVALASPAPYIGALGSAKTHAKRVTALTEAGFSAAQIARIHSPIGLDLGGRRAEEIALSILAEIVAVEHGKGARR